MADVVIDTWLPQTWYGTQPALGQWVWTDGTTIYHTTQSGETYKLNEQTNTWERKIWDLPFTMTQGNWNNIWTAGDDVYYSDGYASHHLKYNKSTDTWESITWTGYTTISGPMIWTDGIDYYYSIGSVQYVINLQTREVTKMTWNGYTQPHGGYIWHCGDVIYNSDGRNQYVLDVATHTWIAKTWNGSFQRPSGYDVWTDGYYYYYSNANNPHNIMEYRLNLETDTWEKMVWKGENRIDGENVWKCGYDIYFSGSAGQLKLALPDPPPPPPPVSDKPVYVYTNGSWIKYRSIYKYVDGEWIAGSSGPAPVILDAWVPATWSGSRSFYGGNVWSDGTNTYLSTGSTQYVKEPDSNTWTTKTWSGINISSLYGQNVWFDGTKYHSANGDTMYSWIPGSDSWEWEHLGYSYIGRYVWTDGIDFYYSDNESSGFTGQYKFNKSTERWETFTWTGLTSFSGERVWNCDGNTYYSYSSIQYKLNRANNSWEPMTWTGLSVFDGNNIWTDGTTVYYSNLNNQYKLNPQTLTWTAITWETFNNVIGENIWTDGKTWYYSSRTLQYYATGHVGPSPTASMHIHERVSGRWQDKT